MCVGFFIHLNIYMNQPTSLSIQDLALLKQLIDVACTRGAFNALEAKSVGQVYENLSAFLDAVIAQAEAQSTSTTQQGETND